MIAVWNKNNFFLNSKHTLWLCESAKPLSAFIFQYNDGSLILGIHVVTYIMIQISHFYYDKNFLLEKLHLFLLDYSSHLIEFKSRFIFVRRVSTHHTFQHECNDDMVKKGRSLNFPLHQKFRWAAIISPSYKCIFWLIHIITSKEVRYSMPDG